MEKNVIKQTSDGSKTLYVPDLDEHYHSTHGAYNEAMHVFIDMGLNHIAKSHGAPIKVLEIGLGTGLNALLSLRWAHQNNIKIDYTGIEKYPVAYDQALEMDYLSIEDLGEFSGHFEKLHNGKIGESLDLSNMFSIHKMQSDFRELEDENAYDLIFYDAFGPRVQADLWSLDMFERMYRATKKDGVLVTYCAKGQVRRDMQTAGYTVERLPGPPGKREMLRASKL